MWIQAVFKLIFAEKKHGFLTPSNVFRIFEIVEIARWTKVSRRKAWNCVITPHRHVGQIQVSRGAKLAMCLDNFLNFLLSKFQGEAVESNI